MSWTEGGVIGAICFLFYFLLRWLVNHINNIMKEHKTERYQWMEVIGKHTVAVSEVAENLKELNSNFMVFMSKINNNKKRCKKGRSR